MGRETGSWAEGRGWSRAGSGGPANRRVGGGAARQAGSRKWDAFGDCELLLAACLAVGDESSSSKSLELRNDSPVPQMESYRQQEIGASGQELPIGFYGAENGPQLQFVGRNRDSSAGGVDVVPPVRKLHKGASSFCARFATMSQLRVQDFFRIK